MFFLILDSSFFNSVLNIVLYTIINLLLIVKSTKYRYLYNMHLKVL